MFTQSQNVTPLMRLLVVNKRCWFHPRSGGAEVNLRETLSRLETKGHQITLLTIGHPDLKSTEKDQGVYIRRFVSDFDLPPPWDTLLSHILITVYFHYYQFRIRHDIVYYSQSPLPWLLISRYPTVAIFHHLGFKKYGGQPFPFNWIEHIATLIGIWHEKGSAVISVSNSLTRILIQHGHNPELITEIKNGINIKQYKYSEGASKPTVMYMGVLDKYKGADRLPSIHSQIENQFDSTIKFNIVGKPGTETNVIKHYCELSNSATFHGYVTNEKKVELLEDAWVLIVPSRIEAWGIVVIQANACGTPAVGADVPGLSDSIINGKTGILTNGADTKKFASQVVNLLKNRDKRYQLGKAARKWAEEHSWDAAADSLEEVLLENTARTTT